MNDKERKEMLIKQMCRELGAKDAKELASMLNEKDKKRELFDKFFDKVTR